MIIIGFIVANIIMLPLSVYYCNFLATAVLRLNRMILSGIVLTLCVTGAFAVSNNVFNIYVMVFFGFIGYTFNNVQIGFLQSPMDHCFYPGKHDGEQLDSEHEVC